MFKYLIFHFTGISRECINANSNSYYYYYCFTTTGAHLQVTIQMAQPLHARIDTFLKDIHMDNIRPCKDYTRPLQISPANTCTYTNNKKCTRKTADRQANRPHRTAFVRVRCAPPKLAVHRTVNKSHYSLLLWWCWQMVSAVTSYGRPRAVATTHM